MSVKTEPDSAVAEAVHKSFRFLYAVVAVLGVCWLFSGIKQIPAGEQAFVIRFGKIHRFCQEPGLVLALPRPFDTVMVLPSKERQISLDVSELEFLRKEDDRSVGIGLHPRNDGGYVLTGDGGVVHLRAGIIYSIANPAKACLEVADLDAALKRAFCASAIEVCGGSTIQELLVTGLGRAAGMIKTRMTERVGRGRMDLGVIVRRVDLTAALPEKAQKAFDMAQSASAEASGAVAKAEKSARFELQEANREKTRILEDAQAKNREIISRAAIVTNDINSQMAHAQGSDRAGVLNRLYHESFDRDLQMAGRVIAVPGTQTSSIYIPAE